MLSALSFVVCSLGWTFFDLFDFVGAQLGYNVPGPTTKVTRVMASALVLIVFFHITHKLSKGPPFVVWFADGHIVYLFHSSLPSISKRTKRIFR